MPVIRKGVLVSLAYLMMEGLLDKLLFLKEMPFLKVLLYPSAEELYTRFLGVAGIMVLSLIYYTCTKLAARDEKPREAERFSGDPGLIIDLSNQIKTPLNAIVGFSELLKDPKIPDETRMIYANHVNTSGKYMIELVNNIADITRIEARQLSIRKEKCQLNQALNDLHGYYDKQIKEKGKKDLAFLLTPGIQDQNFTILTDEGKLRQILKNLLENAIAFTDEGSVEFGYTRKDDIFLEFFVRDTGSGFSMERLEMIFERFNKVIDHKMKPFDSAALRITICKHLVKLLGGKLSAKSELTKGSTFSFTLPMNEVEVYPESEIDDGEIVKQHYWADKHILIAEDVESNFIYLEEILKQTSVKIKWAQNGAEAVKYCEEDENYDVVLMDILMPEMDGFEAAQKIKKLRRKLPIIAQTAYSLEEDDYKESLKYFDRYLVKPIWSHDLLNTLSVYLS